MQIEIYKPHEGDNVQAVEWNYSELKQWLTDGLALYKGRVYDDNQMTEAKKNAAELRKLAAAIDAKRKDMKKKFLAPYEEFEAQAKELVGLINQQVDEIAAQIKAHDDEAKARKLEQIKALYAEVFGDLAELIPFAKIENPKWLNVTYRMAQVETDLRAKAGAAHAALSSIKALSLDPELDSQVKHTYLETLDLSRALAAKARIEDERAKLAEYERRRQEQTAQTASEERVAAYSAAAQAQDAAPAVEAAQTRYTVRFWARGTEAQIRGLKQYIKGNGIEYGPVR